MNDFFTQLPQLCREIHARCESTGNGGLFEMLQGQTGRLEQLRPAMERCFRLPFETSSVFWRYEEGTFRMAVNNPWIGVGWYTSFYQPPDSYPPEHDLTRASFNVIILYDPSFFESPGVAPGCVLLPMAQAAAEHLKSDPGGHSWCLRSEMQGQVFIDEFRRDVQSVLNTWIAWCEGAVYKSYRTRFDELIVPKLRLSVTENPPEVILGDKTYDLTDEQFDYLVEIIEAKGIPVGMRNDLRSHPKRIFETFPPAIQAVIIVTNKGVAIDTSKVDI